MKLFLQIVLACLLALLPGGCKPNNEGLVIPPPPTTPTNPTDPTTPTTPTDPTADEERLARLGQTPIVMAYFTEYTPEANFPKLEDIKCFTHINAGHARFVNTTTGDGGLTIKDPGTDYIRRLVAFKRSYPKLKVLLMIGGYGEKADGFSEMAKNPDKRKLFCDECVRLCNELGLDGVDIDWEYPTHSAGASGSFAGTGADPSDTKNFTTLVKELREALGKDKLISYAAADNGKYMDHKDVLEYVDYINVMTYSMGDPPYHNSPLYRSNLTKSRSSEESIAIFHDEKGVPYDRMNFGVGFYGHGDGTVYSSSVKYYYIDDILNKGKYTDSDGHEHNVAGYNIRHWDPVGKNCYLGNAGGTMYASYEDVESLGYRVQFLKGKGMLGVFAWEYGEDDAKGTLRYALAKWMKGENPTQPDPPSGGTDLGVSGTANCYVVSAPGTYKFKTVKGNTTTSVGTVASATVLWETCNNAETVSKGSVIASVGYSGGYISFATPSTLKPGNALIAAKDASGKILWSWHIWIPKTAFTASASGLSAFKIMSRNLGALVDADGSKADVQSLGLLYQWGRKDPFPGPRAVGTNEAATISGTVMTKGGQMTVEQTIASPTVFAANDGDWLTTANADLWGDTSKAKSQYDPCPPGYKVPRREDVSAFFAIDNLTEAPQWQWNGSASWFSVGSPALTFPLAGYISTSGSYSGSGSEAKIWNAHHDSANGATKAYGQFIKSGPSTSRSAQAKAYGASVRCISLEEAPFQNAPGMPVQGSMTRKVFDSGVVELSGLCLSKDKDFLWGVGDEGYLYKFTNIDGAVDNITASQPLDHDKFGGESSSGGMYYYDMEGVTLDPSTGDLYFAYEPKRVFRLKSPYTTVERKLFDVEEAAEMGNNGMEGITWYKGDLLVGSQSGATLWRYTVTGTKVWKKLLGTIAPWIQEVGDLCYDSQTDLLWVADSEAHKLFVFDGDVTTLKAMYDVSSIGNAESVCVDHARSCVWVGDDGSTSKIYKISFSGL